MAWFTLCFTVDSESHTLSPLLMAIAALSHHGLLSLSTVKHAAIMTPVPEMPETSLRCFPITALLCDDPLHSFIRKCTMVDSAFVFHQRVTVNYKPSIVPFSRCRGLQECMTLSTCISGVPALQQPRTVCFLSEFHRQGHIAGLIFPHCTLECSIKLCFTIDTEIISPASVIC